MNFRSFYNAGIIQPFDNGAHWQSIAFDHINLKYFYENIGRGSDFYLPFPNDNLSNLDFILNQLINFHRLQ